MAETEHPTDRQRADMHRLDDADALWDQLADRVAAFAAAWDSDHDLPVLKDFVPEQPVGLRRLALVELIKVDLDYRWTKGKSPKEIEEYLAEFPELASSGDLPVDLLYEEYHIRRQAGDSIDAADYRRRFPEHAADIYRLIGMADPQATTSLFANARQIDLEVGDQIDDFDLLTKLGKGAFANVFLARQQSMQRLVALKISADRGSEPQTLAQLDHPHIVRVYDQRVLSERGARLLYMQYVKGGTLQDAIGWLRELAVAQRDGSELVAAVDRALDGRGESPPVGSALRRQLAEASLWELVCWVGMTLADALHYAHERGVLHRDLKPANILLTDEGAPKLVDFNISFCSKVDGASPAAYFGGSLAYMSPEQLEACNPSHDRQPESLTPASDIYALGVVLWELLTTHRPFADSQLPGDWAALLGTMTEARRSGLSQEALQDLPPPAPSSLREVLFRCLDPEEGRRYGSAAELAADLRLCLHPEAHQLLCAPSAGWRGLVRRFAAVAILVTAVVPNAVAGAFNYFYNRAQIVQKLRDEDAMTVFWNVQSVVNSIAYPLGVVILLGLFWPVWRALRARRRQEKIEELPLAAARSRCLAMGHYVALIGIVAWTIAGFVYPVAMHAAGATLSILDFFHFFISLIICGLIAATYPFFGATVFAVRGWFPALFDLQFATQSDRRQLAWLGRIVWVYLGMAALLPMLAIVLTLNFTGDVERWVPLVVSSGSLAGLVAIFYVARLLQRDVASVMEVIGTEKHSLDK